MSSSPVAVMALSGDRAVSFVRNLMGDTDPKKAKPELSVLSMETM